MNKRTALLKQVTCEKTRTQPFENTTEKRNGAIESENDSKANCLINTSKEGITSPLCAQMLEHQITQAATLLKIEPEQLANWLNLFPAVSQPTQLSLLHIINRSGLDPFLEEVVFSQYAPNHWEAAITVNGWSTLLNRSNVFSGMTFVQGPEDEQLIPDWMECSIYRSDRLLPTTVREYFCEVKAPTEAWQKLPRRMLRHKVFSQCARLAFGLPT
jgi:hypothetical protein